MRAINETEKISLARCREIFGKEGSQYTDAEIKIMRDWLYQMAALTRQFLEGKSQETILEIKRKIDKRK